MGDKSVARMQARRAKIRVVRLFPDIAALIRATDLSPIL
jgi:hypothetical protein